MSQYLNFALRYNDKFIPINSYSRNNLIYELFSPYVPYENVCPVTMKMIKTIQEEIKEALQENKDRLAAVESERHFIHKCDNPLSEKIEAFTDIKQRADVIKELIDEYNNCLSITEFLYGMLDEAKYGDEDVMPQDENEFLYAGIECWGPTMNDVETSSS